MWARCAPSPSETSLSVLAWPGAAPGSATWASITVACAPSPSSMMLRVVTRRPSVAVRAKTRSSGLSSRAPLADADDGAVRHERGVERDHGFLAGGALARSGHRRRGRRTWQRRRQRRDLQPLGSGRASTARAHAAHRRTPCDRRRARPALPAPHRSQLPTPWPRRRQPAAAPPSARCAGRSTSTPRCAGAAGRAPRTRRWRPCAPPPRRVRPAASRRQPRSSGRAPARPWSLSSHGHACLAGLKHSRGPCS